MSIVNSGTDSIQNAPPRYAPETPLPPYSYVTGRFPHPLRNPAGHSYCAAKSPDESAPPSALDPQRPFACRPFLFGVDLFNYGYYWEAHETWEGLWHACGRSGPAADFLKGLIKLAAAGVKAREGRPPGVSRHAARAHELFQQTAAAQPSERFLGLSLLELSAFAAELALHPRVDASDPQAAMKVVFGFQLRPA